MSLPFFTATEWITKKGFAFCSGVSRKVVSHLVPMHKYKNIFENVVFSLHFGLQSTHKQRVLGHWKQKFEKT